MEIQSASIYNHFDDFQPKLPFNNINFKMSGPPEFSKNDVGKNEGNFSYNLSLKGSAPPEPKTPIDDNNPIKIFDRLIENEESLFDLNSDSNFGIDIEHMLFHLNLLNSEDKIEIDKEEKDYTETRTSAETKKKIGTKNKIICIVERPNTSTEKNILGRIPNVEKTKGKEGKHTKIGEDNIMRKNNIKFIESVREKINHDLKIKKPDKNLVLRKLAENGCNNIKVENMLNWFDEPMRSYFSSDISSKFRNVDKNMNQKIIKQIDNDDELQEVREILDYTIIKMYKKYINNEVIEGFRTLKDALDDLRKKGEKEDYIKDYERIALNLEDIIKKKRPRGSKKSKKSKKNN